MNWFYSPDGTERFEVSEEALRHLILDGKVMRDTLVWREGLADWMAAGAANPEWFGPPPVDLPPPAGLPPPVELPPPVVSVPPPPDPAEGSPWSRPAPDPPPGSGAPPSPAEVALPVEITVLPPPPPVGDYAPLPSPPAPPPPGYPVTVMPPPPRDSAAMSSAISGGIGLVGAVSSPCCCFGGLVALVAGVSAIVFGHMAYGKAKGHPEAERDKNLAVVGMVLGYLTIAISLGGLVFGLLVGGLSAVTQGLHHP